jgi:hypothetical protein
MAVQDKSPDSANADRVFRMWPNYLEAASKPPDTFTPIGFHSLASGLSRLSKKRKKKRRYHPNSWAHFKAILGISGTEESQGYHRSPEERGQFLYPCYFKTA